LGRLTDQTRIAAPPRRVWRIIEKHLEHPESSDASGSPGKIKAVGGMPLSVQRSGVGTRTRWVYNYRKRPFSWDDIVTVWKPMERVEWETTSTWKMRDSFNLMQEEYGTRLVYQMDYKLPYGLIGRLYGRFLLEPRMRKHIEAVLGTMKSLAEHPFSVEQAS